MIKQFNIDLFELKKIDNQKYPKIITFPSGKPMPNGEVIIYPNFFEELESQRLFEELQSKIRWRQDKIKMFGKEWDIP
ncbi:MAG: alpha-ketoglutarate-dependent dioxygenase AlkB, partial [Cyanobacteria bacterium P01_F01_bin.143]